MEIEVKKFSELTLEQLYKILKLRFDVFVSEQKSFYDEYDNKDYDAIHFFIEDKQMVVGYLRLYRKTSLSVSLGRIVVQKEYRKMGVGRKLVQEGINYAKSNLKVDKIDISAQYYLKDFYESFGFKSTSEPYDDGGVIHIDMTLEV
ncbi:MAG TPA: GNAT family N-acetyltransferase [Candidatus Dojkabacteria bacterium]|nr:GNAT family N-acetyltransferase [Candidatus Dojkabacteria bacterium]